MYLAELCEVYTTLYTRPLTLKWSRVLRLKYWWQLKIAIQDLHGVLCVSQVATSWTCVELCVGWPNGLASFLASAQKSQKTHFKASCISLSDKRLMGVTQLALTWVGCWLGGQTLKNLHQLGCKFDLDQSECKSMQVHTRRGKTESQVEASWEVASTCDTIWPGLYI